MFAHGDLWIEFEFLNVLIVKLARPNLLQPDPVRDEAVAAAAQGLGEDVLLVQQLVSWQADGFDLVANEVGCSDALLVLDVLLLLGPSLLHVGLSLLHVLVGQISGLRMLLSRSVPLELLQQLPVVLIRVHVAFFGEQFTNELLDLGCLMPELLDFFRALAFGFLDTELKLLILSQLGNNVVEFRLIWSDLAISSNLMLLWVCLQLHYLTLKLEQLVSQHDLVVLVLLVE